jgi:hypothetical protein
VLVVTDSPLMIDQAAFSLLKESEAWLAAQLLAKRYFSERDSKFVTVQKKNGQWIAVQWVTTSFAPFNTEVRVYPGRVGIARRRRTAFQRMTHSVWRSPLDEPSGPTIGVQVYARLGNK